MFKKIKKDYEDFINARREIKDLKGKCSKLESQKDEYEAICANYIDSSFRIYNLASQKTSSE